MKKLIVSAVVVVFVVAGSAVTGFAATNNSQSSKSGQSFSQLYTEVLQKQTLPLQ